MCDVDALIKTINVSHQKAEDMPTERVAKLLPLGLLRSVDDRQWEILFFLLILGYSVLLVYEAWGYGPDARLFPLMVGIPLVGMLVVKIGLLLFADRIDLSENDMFGSVTSDLDDSEDIAESEETSKFDTLVRYRREYEMVGWTFVLIGLIWLLGFRLSMLVFIPVFIYRYERAPKRAVGVTIFTWIATDLIFVRLLSVTFWEGVIIPDWIIQLLP